MASPGCSCASCWGYHTLPLTHSSSTTATADLEQGSAKPARFDWCWLEEHWGMLWYWWEEHWGLLSSTDSTAVAGSEHPSSPQVRQPQGFLLPEAVQGRGILCPSTDLFSHQSTGLTNFPIFLETWSGDSEALMADASSMTPSAFPCSRSQCRLLPLGMALTNPQHKVPPELGKELAYLLVFFLPCKHLILIHRKKLGASPWTRMFITTTDRAYLHIMRTKCH